MVRETNRGRMERGVEAGCNMEEGVVGETGGRQGSGLGVIPP